MSGDLADTRIAMKKQWSQLSSNLPAAAMPFGHGIERLSNAGRAYTDRRSIM
jgi:hypothetical protein